MDAAAHHTSDWIPHDEALEPLGPDEAVLEALSAHLEIPMKQLRPLDRLHADLGITPLGLVLLVLDIEDVLGVRLGYELLEQVYTVGDLLDVVRAQYA